MKKKIVFGSIGIGVSAAVLLGVSAHSLLGRTPSAVQEASASSHEASAVEHDAMRKTVRVFQVGQSKSSATSYTGVIQARHESDHAFRVSGKIIQRKVEVGDRVAQGDILAELDPVDYELAVRLAEADVAAAAADASNFSKEESRHVELVKTRSVSQSEVDRVSDGRRAAEARLERSKRALALAVNRHDYCSVRAEANGVVVRVMGEVGEVVAEGRPIVRIAQTDEMEAVIHLPENRANITLGDLARGTVWAGTQSDYQLRLRELAPTADAVTRTYQARFTVLSPGSDVALGRTMTLHFDSAPDRNMMDIPLTSIHQSAGAPSVWRLENDRLVAVPIHIERYKEDAAVVSQGLAHGDRIVAAGVQKLDANTRVQAWGNKQ
ncbi:MAG: efflux RND transporter periplasmic adaptor subunit [Pirellula sp.]